MPVASKTETPAPNPLSRFRHPRDVVAASDLSRDEKCRLLLRWEQDARDLQVASEEGMASDKPSLLAAVHEAMKALGLQQDPEQRPPTKAGGGTGPGADSATH